MSFTSSNAHLWSPCTFSLCRTHSLIHSSLNHSLSQSLALSLPISLNLCIFLYLNLCVSICISSVSESPFSASLESVGPSYFYILGTIGSACSWPAVSALADAQYSQIWQPVFTMFKSVRIYSRPSTTAVQSASRPRYRLLTCHQATGHTKASGIITQSRLPACLPYLNRSNPSLRSSTWSR